MMNKEAKQHGILKRLSDFSGNRQTNKNRQYAVQQSTDMMMLVTEWQPRDGLDDPSTKED